MRTLGRTRGLTRIQDPGAANGPFDRRILVYREDHTRIVGGRLDAERRKICAREHEQPNFKIWLIFA